MRRCCMCHQEKPEADFAFRSIATGVRQGHCRACHAAYRRQHYLANREAYIAREVARMNRYRLENRERILEYLLAHPCCDCGETDPVVLEFDHRDRATKRSEVARLAASKQWKVVLVEIEKCDVRCGNCHRRRTAQQLQWGKPSTSTDDTASSDAGVPMVLSLEPTELRRCTGCGLLKPISEFSIKNKRTGRRAWHCHACVAATSREHYRRNKPRYLARNRRNKGRYRSRNRSRKAEYVAGLACVDCGESDPVLLEFDHRDAADKLANVSRLMAAHSWARVQAEIAKCDIRCVNCHRRRTAAQFGWTKHRPQTPAKMSATRE